MGTLYLQQITTSVCGIFSYPIEAEERERERERERWEG
jgi:hypothetical protein